MGKDVVGISELQDKAANQTVESMLAFNEDLDGGDPKSGGVIHEAPKGMMGKVAPFALDPSELVIIEKVMGEIDRFGPQRSLKKLAKQITEENGAVGVNQRLDPCIFVEFFVLTSGPLVGLADEPCGFEPDWGQDSGDGSGITSNKLWWDKIGSTSFAGGSVESLLLDVERRGEAIGAKLWKNPPIKVPLFSCKVHKLLKLNKEPFLNGAKV